MDAMPYKEFCRHVAKAGFSLKDFGDLVGLRQASLSNMRPKGVPNHWALVATLMGELAEVDVDVRAVVRHQFDKLKPKAARGAAPKTFVSKARLAKAKTTQPVAAPAVKRKPGRPKKVKTDFLSVVSEGLASLSKPVNSQPAL